MAQAADVHVDSQYVPLIRSSILRCFLDKQTVHLVLLQFVDLSVLFGDDE
jgi:hypothetical protein